MLSGAGRGTTRVMPLHIIKLCVGTAEVAELVEWQAKHRKIKFGGKACVYHTTFQTPKRQDEVLDGGSLYWVMKGMITVRQRLVGFKDGNKEDGSACCLLILDPEPVLVRPTPRRAFQGWRYLTAEDAPADLGKSGRSGIAQMPVKMQKDLADLGLL